MAEQIYKHVSPDGLLTFLVVTDETGDVALGFEGYPWHTHADILAALSGTGTTPEVAVEQFMAALLGNRAAIVVTTAAGRIKDVWVSDDPSEEDLPKSSDEVIELRFWDGTPWQAPVV